MVDERGGVGGGFSRRELIKKSAVAGGLAWAAPVLMTNAAVAQVGDPTCTPECNQCTNGQRVYAKFAPGNSAPSPGSNCLSPAEPVVKVSLRDLVCGGLVAISDDVATNDSAASFDILQPLVLRIIRTSIKGEASCYTSCCTNGFATVTEYSSSHKPPDEGECTLSGTDRVNFPYSILKPKTQGGTDIIELFKYKHNNVDCGTAPSPLANDACCEGPTSARFSTDSLPKNRTTPGYSGGILQNENLNFIEILFCLSSGSKVPQCSGGGN